MIVLDACLLIAHLNQHDRHHRAASGYLRESAQEVFLMHSLNLAEVLVGGARAGRGEEMRSDLERIGIHVADRHPEEPIRLARLRAESGLRLPDCCALDTALSNDCALATFDERLALTAKQYRVTLAAVPAD